MYLTLLLCILLVTAEYLQYESDTFHSQSNPIHSLSTLLLSATSVLFNHFVPDLLLLTQNQLLSLQAFHHFRPGLLKSKTSYKSFFQFSPSPSISIPISCLTQPLLRPKHRNHRSLLSISMYVYLSSSLNRSKGADRCSVRGGGCKVCTGI